jgi:hypothetical protein
MPTVHELMRDVPTGIYALMVALPLAMTIAAVTVGWYARQGTLRRRAEDPAARVPKEDALQAGLTMAVVPFAFLLLMLWARFG